MRYTLLMYVRVNSYKPAMELECKSMKEVDAYIEMGKDEYELIKLWDNVTKKYIKTLSK